MLEFTTLVTVTEASFAVVSIIVESETIASILYLGIESQTVAPGTVASVFYVGIGSGTVVPRKQSRVCRVDLEDQNLVSCGGGLES